MTVAKLLLSSFLLHSLSEAFNQPPRFQNYFFQSYLLIYENTPVVKPTNTSGPLDMCIRQMDSEADSKLTNSLRMTLMIDKAI
ncbi:hypothetical protein MHYP_G00045680 [Metynnis hypsauchen]